PQPGRAKRVAVGNADRNYTQVARPAPAGDEFGQIWVCPRGLRRGRAILGHIRGVEQHIPEDRLVAWSSRTDSVDMWVSCHTVGPCTDSPYNHSSRGTPSSRRLSSGKAVPAV